MAPRRVDRVALLVAGIVLGIVAVDGLVVGCLVEGDTAPSPPSNAKSNGLPTSPTTALNGRDPFLGTARLRGTSFTRGPSSIADEHPPLTEAEIEGYREELAYLLGVQDLYAAPPEDRPPVNPVITATIGATGYTIYKLYYESLPDYYVSANLYIPNSDLFPLPRPAVILTHGHWSAGKAGQWVQVPAIGLVLQGYVVLAYDVASTWDRAARPWYFEGYDPLANAQAYAGGPLSAGLQAYEVSRAIDYLMTLPDIADMNHFAVTGASGGGSQTIYAAALDKRIDVIVPVVFSSIGYTHGFGAPDEVIPLLWSDMGREILLTLVYPAKVSFLNERDDVAKYLPESTYAALGHADWYQYLIPDTVHAYSGPFRERMYAWLGQWLLGAPPIPWLPDPSGVSDDMAIRTADELRVPLPLDNRWFLDVSAEWRARLPGLSLPATRSEWDEQASLIRTNLADLFHWAASAEPQSVLGGDPASSPETIEILPEDLSIDAFYNGAVYTWDSWLDAQLYKPSRSAPWPCVVLMNPPELLAGDPGYEAVYSPLDTGPSVRALVDAGYAVLTVPLRFTGPPLPPPEELPYLFEVEVGQVLYAYGMSPFGKHVRDVSSAVLALRDRLDILPTRISVWGMGPAGPIALTAGAADETLCQVVADRSVVNFGRTINDRFPAWSYSPKILHTADLPDLGAAIAPRRLVLANAWDDNRLPLPAAETAVRMDRTGRGFDARDGSGQFRILAGASEEEIVAALDVPCGPATDCVNAPDGTACDDGNTCTRTDTCQSGMCVGEDPTICTASDQCHVGACDRTNGQCLNPDAPDGTSCTDGDACTQTDTCEAGTCAGANPVVCTASDQCHVAGTCDPGTGQCSNPSASDGTSCDDVNLCNGKDACLGGTCSMHLIPLICADANPCTDDSCDPATGCVHTNNAAACNDGNPCTQNDTCRNGTCVGNPIVCEDSDQCHVAGTCVLGYCTNPFAPNGTLCTDGNACNGQDSCRLGACTQHVNPLTCDDGNVCTNDSCSPVTGCVHTNNSVACDDGNLCNGTDSCLGGTCSVHVNPVECTASDQCHVAGTCNPADDQCSNPNAPDGTSCEEGEFCTVSDTCQSGACIEGDVRDCADGVNCTVDSCNEDADACDNAPDDALCDDGLYCDGAETCDAVSDCQSGVAPDCTDGVNCTVDSCNEGADACDNAPFDTLCDNGLFCDGAETCNVALGCQDGADPCDPGTQSCDESADQCEALDPNAGKLLVTVFLHGYFNGTIHSPRLPTIGIDLYVGTTRVYRFTDLPVSAAGLATVDLVAGGVAGGNYDVVVRHLNHVNLMSADPMAIDPATSNAIDFRVPANVECGTATLYNRGGAWTMAAGDITQDRRVNSADYLKLRQSWNLSVSSCDLDGDGFCRSPDYLKLRQSWNTTGCAPLP